MHQIRNTLSEISERLRREAALADTGPRQIRLVAVSKTRSSAEVQAAFDAGIRDFGENYLQEAITKIDDLQALPITWHFVGAIQSNKTSVIANRFDWVQTIDREKIARRLSDARPADAKPLNVLVQVNPDAEPQKAGVAPEALAQLLAAVVPLPQLRVRGLMAIPKPIAQNGDPARAFRRMRELFDASRSAGGSSWDTLSMGMSGDYQAAIANGSTMVRIGTALFGPRDP